MKKSHRIVALIIASLLIIGAISPIVMYLLGAY